MFIKSVHTLSKAIGLESFSMGAEAEDDDEVDAVFDGCDVDDATEVVEENCGRSEYRTSWLFADGRETAVAVMLVDATVASPVSINDDDKLSLSLSSGTLKLVDADSMTYCTQALDDKISLADIFWHWFMFGSVNKDFSLIIFYNQIT